jgi:FkbM family methyltransferase
MKIVVEIGANNGDDTAKLLAAHNPDRMYAAEPDPVLFAGLVQRFKHEPRLTLWPFAVDTDDAVKTFNIMDHERGINSLYPLHANLLNTPLKKHWQYQRGMTGQITVHTINFAKLLDIYGIDHIDYLWTDCQGNDLLALKSMGDRIQHLKQGRCEVTYKVPVYDTEVDNTYESMSAFLSSQGFLQRVDYVHEDNSEIDIAYWRE